jgi:hypothetical protein
VERQSKEPRSLEAYCRGGQGPPRAVAPFGGEYHIKYPSFLLLHVLTQHRYVLPAALFRYQCKDVRIPHREPTHEE